MKKLKIFTTNTLYFGTNPGSQMKTRNLNLRTEFMNLVGSISVVELITNENAVKLIEEIYEELTNTTKENL